jgi:MFS family permease
MLVTNSCLLKFCPGSQIGTVVGTALSGVLIQYSFIGWPSVFYLFGALGVLWFIAWTLLCYNDPQSHPFISDEEKTFLEKSIGGIDNKKVSVLIVYDVQTSYTNNKIKWRNN